MLTLENSKGENTIGGKMFKIPKQKQEKIFK